MLIEQLHKRFRLTDCIRLLVALLASFLSIETALHTSNAQAQLPAGVHCPQGQILYLEWAGVIDSTYGSGLICPYSLQPYVWSSLGSWGSTITSNCTGAYWGNTIQWLQPYFYTPPGYTVPTRANIDAYENNVPTLKRFEAEADFACAHGYFVIWPTPPNPGKQCPACGDPINPADGNEYQTFTDYASSDGRLNLTRSYNSSTTIQGSLGPGWQHNFSRQILNQYNVTLAAPGGHSYLSAIETTAANACTTGWSQIAASTPYPTATATFSSGVCTLSNGQNLPIYSTDLSNAWNGAPNIAATVALQRRDGRIETFSCAAGVCTGRANIPLGLTANSSGFTLTDEAGNTEQYATDGQLSSIVFLDGYAQSFAYNTDGTLSSTSDNHGRSIGFQYTNGILSTAQLPDGTTVSYSYDTYGRLNTVTFPGSKTLTYGYTNSQYQSALTSVTDEDSQLFATVGYDSQGRANFSSLGGGADTTAIVYNSGGSATITDASGAVRTYHYQNVQGRQSIASITGAPCDSCGSASTTYDAAGYLESTTDFNGNAAHYIYDDAHGLETQRIKGFGTTAAKTTNTAWNTTFRVPTQVDIIDSGGVTETTTKLTYNARGQVLSRCEIDPAVSGASSYTCGSAPNAPTGVRQWTYTYCESVGGVCPLVGLLLTVDGPRTEVTDVTTYAYYTTSYLSGCATGGTCHYAGDLQSVTDALGHVTTYVNYDRNGRVTRMQDANGTYTDMAYHPRGWLLTRTVRANADGSASVNDATTTFAYDNVGNVSKVTQPDGDYLSYTYDTAHRLTDVQDNLVNHVHYTLDGAGNRTGEQTYDPSSSLKRSLTRQYDSLNHLTGILNATPAAVQTYQNPSEAPPTGITYTNGYDGNGNAIYSIDGTSAQVGTEQQYDPLNRLLKTLQDHAGTGATHDTTTQFAYDARDNLRSVTDPDNLVTSYTYDGLNNLTQLSSPDTATTSYGYDAAGNRTSQTDARTVTTNYSYDALNRLIGITYPTTSLNVTYAYDQSNAITGCSTSYPIGRLTKITDDSGSTTYCYDRRGNVLAKTQITNGTTLATGYAYTNGDRIATISYPSTAVATYTRNSIGKITSIAYKATPTGTAATLVSSATYLPFGPLNVLTFGNGRTLTKTYDQDYAIDKVVSSVSTGLVIDATVDLLGNLTNASSTVGASPPTQLYQYDPLYRLATITDGNASPLLSLAYDNAGDRMSKEPLGKVAQSQSYLYTSGTHHLTKISGSGGSTRAVDANGNTTAIATTTFTYDNRNRLSAAGTETYNYNGKGERVSKSSPATLFVYAENGMLLGEYNSAGTVQREYIPLDGLMVGAATGTFLYYVETDQLGTPRLVIQPGSTPANDVIVWKWDYFASNSAFGENTPSVQTITFNPRFPGQYFDQETGLNYNYFRDYEPGTGRYVESDPIGMYGGLNTYAYVSDHPLTTFDPKGLDAAPWPPPVAPPPTGIWPRIWKVCRVANPVVTAILIGITPTSTSGCDQPNPPPQNHCDKGDSHCEEEISDCRRLCRKASNDPDMKNIWGGSWARCMAGCVSFACQDHLDPNEYQDRGK